MATRSSINSFGTYLDTLRHERESGGEGGSAGSRIEDPVQRILAPLQQWGPALLNELASYVGLGVAPFLDVIERLQRLGLVRVEHNAKSGETLVHLTNTGYAMLNVHPQSDAPPTDAQSTDSDAQSQEAEG